MQGVRGKRVSQTRNNLSELETERMSLSIVTIHEVLRARRRRLPDGVDIYTMIPFLERSPTLVIHQQDLYSLFHQCEASNSMDAP